MTWSELMKRAYTLGVDAREGGRTYEDEDEGWDVAWQALSDELDGPLPRADYDVARRYWERGYRGEPARS